MEKFFAQGTLEPQDILPGLKREIVERKIFPVLCASSSLGIGAIRILDACVALLPSPESRRDEGVGKDGKPVVVFCNEKDHAVAQVFKTVSDPFAGRISYLRVLAGHFQSDGTYWNSRRRRPRALLGPLPAAGQGARRRPGGARRATSSRSPSSRRRSRATR